MINIKIKNIETNKKTQKKLLSILKIQNTLKIKKTTSLNNGKIFKAFSIFS